MPDLPLRPSLRNYRGSNEARRRKVDEYNRAAWKVADHVNTLIANDPDEIQQYTFALIAIHLDVSVDIVREAISDGGYNGITLSVDAQDRENLAAYKGNSTKR